MEGFYERDPQKELDLYQQNAHTLNVSALRKMITICRKKSKEYSYKEKYWSGKLAIYLKEFGLRKLI